MATRRNGGGPKAKRGGGGNVEPEPRPPSTPFPEQIVTPDGLLHTIRAQKPGPRSSPMALRNVQEYDYDDEETIPGLIALQTKPGQDLDSYNDLRLAQLAEEAFADHDPVPPAAHLTDFSERKVDEIREKSMAKIRRPIPRLPTPEVSEAPTPPPSVGEKFARDVILDRPRDGPHTMEDLDEYLRASSCTDYDGDWRPLWRTTERLKGKKSEEEMILETEKRSWFPPTLDTNIFSQEGAGVMLHFQLLKRLGTAMFLNALLAMPILLANLSGSLLLTKDVTGFGRMTIANIGNYPDAWTDFTDWSDRELSPGTPLREETFNYALFDCIGCSYFLVVLLLFEFRVVPEEVRKQDEELVSPSDFSLMISGIPDVPDKYQRDEEYRDGLKEGDRLVRYFSPQYEDELRNFFNKHSAAPPGEEAPVSPGGGLGTKPVAALVPLNSGKILGLRASRDKLRSQILRLESRLDAHQADARTEYLQGADGEMVPETVSTDGLLTGFFRPKILAHWNRKLASKQAALAQTEKEIKSEDEHLKEGRWKDGEQISKEGWRQNFGVIVAFNTERHKDNVLAWFDSAEPPVFHGEFLHVNVAPEPSGLFYENLQPGVALDRKGRLWTVAMTLVFLTIVNLYFLGLFIGPQPVEFQETAPADAWLIAPDPGTQDPRDARFEVCEAQIYSDAACTEPIAVANVFTRESLQTADRVIDGETEAPCGRATMWTSESPPLGGNAAPPPRAKPLPPATPGWRYTPYPNTTNDLVGMQYIGMGYFRADTCPACFYAGWDDQFLTETACKRACADDPKCGAIAYCAPEDVLCSNIFGQTASTDSPRKDLCTEEMYRDDPDCEETAPIMGTCSRYRKGCTCTEEEFNLGWARTHIDKRAAQTRRRDPRESGHTSFRKTTFAPTLRDPGTGRLHSAQDLVTLRGPCMFGLVSCDGRRCLPSEKMCDGVLDCDDGQDEYFCAGPSGSRFACQLGRSCSSATGRSCAFPTDGSCDEDRRNVAPPPICSGKAIKALARSGYCDPVDLDACLCLTLLEEHQGDMYCIPGVEYDTYEYKDGDKYKSTTTFFGATMSILEHLQRRCAETQVAKRAPPCDAVARATLVNVPECASERWCACAAVLEEGVDAPIAVTTVDGVATRDFRYASTRCDYGVPELPASMLAGDVEYPKGARSTLLGYLRGLCEAQEGQDTYAKNRAAEIEVSESDTHLTMELSLLFDKCEVRNFVTAVQPELIKPPFVPTPSPTSAPTAPTPVPTMPQPDPSVIRAVHVTVEQILSANEIEEEIKKEVHAAVDTSATAGFFGPNEVRAALLAVLIAQKVPQLERTLIGNALRAQLKVVMMLVGPTSAPTTSPTAAPTVAPTPVPTPLCPPLPDRMDDYANWIPRAVATGIEARALARTGSGIIFEPDWVSAEIKTLRPAGAPLVAAQIGGSLMHRGIIRHAPQVLRALEYFTTGKVPPMDAQVDFLPPVTEEAERQFEKTGLARGVTVALSLLDVVDQWLVPDALDALDNTQPKKPNRAGDCKPGWELVDGVCWDQWKQEVHIEIHIRIPAGTLLRSTFVQAAKDALLEWFEGRNRTEAPDTSHLREWEIEVDHSFDDTSPFKAFNSSAPAALIGNFEILELRLMQDTAYRTVGGCPAHLFDCGNVFCIQPEKQCNGIRDCPSGIDEADCEPDCTGAIACETGEGRPKCVPPAWICDGVSDCISGEDEEGCVFLEKNLWKVGYGGLSVQPRLQTPFVALELAAPQDVKCVRISAPATSNDRPARLQVFSCAAANLHRSRFESLLRDPWTQCQPNGANLEYEPLAPEDANYGDDWSAYVLPQDRVARVGSGKVVSQSRLCGFAVADRVNFPTADRLFRTSPLGGKHPIVRCFCLQRSKIAEEVSLELCAATNQEEDSRLSVILQFVFIQIIFHILQQYFVTHFANLCKLETVSDRNLFMFDRLAPVQIFTSSGLIFLAHHKFYGTNIGITTGAHADMTQDWFAQVGALVPTLLVVSWFLPSGARVVRTVILMFYRKGLMERFAYTECEKLDWYINPEFNLATRAATLAELLALVVIYSPAMPILWWIGIITLFINYWSDKLTLLRGARRVAHSDGALTVRVLRVVMLSVIIHAVVAMWTFSEQILFPSPGAAPVPELNEALGAEGYAAYLAARQANMFQAQAAKPAMALFFISGSILVVQAILSLALMYPTVDKVLRKIPCFKVLLDLREMGNEEGGGSTEQTYAEAIAEMVESGMPAYYDVRFQRRYGGRPTKEIELEDESASDSEPEPESESTQILGPIYDILGNSDRPVAEAPPQPVDGVHIRGARTFNATYAEAKLRAPAEPESAPLDKQVTAERLRIRRADRDLVPKLPKELAYAPLSVPGGTARAFVTGEDSLEVRAASTRLKITVHDKRTVKM